VRDWLTGDVFKADLLVDISNVVRTSRTRQRHRANLTRFARLLDALVAHESDPNLLVYVVADRSLLAQGLLPADQRRTLTGWRDGGLIDVVGDADERLLELAELTGLRVVSADRFRGHRAQHPWLQGNTDQFIAPHLEPDGRLIVRPVDLGVVDEWEISRHEEQDQLKKQGLLVGTRRSPWYDILERTWRCPDRRCSLYDTSRGDYVILPRIRKGRPTCELHGLELMDDGPRSLTVQLKLLVRDACVARFTVQADRETAVGRAPLSGISLTPWLNEQQSQLVSRHHFSLITRDGRLLVKDCSTNGTRISLVARHSRPARVVTLRAGDEHPLGLGDLVSCCAHIAFTRSGRKFPSEIARELTARPISLGAPPTVAARDDVRREQQQASDDA